MSALSTYEAAERLAKVVETAKPTILSEIHAELFPEKPRTGALSAADLVKYVRTGIEADELVSLWNVVFPADRNVRYDEEDRKIHYDEATIGHAEAD